MTKPTLHRKAARIATRSMLRLDKASPWFQRQMLALAILNHETGHHDFARKLLTRQVWRQRQ